MPEVTVEATDWQNVAKEEAAKNLQLRAAISAAARKLVELEDELAFEKGEQSEDDQQKHPRTKAKRKTTKAGSRGRSSNGKKKPEAIPAKG